MSSIKTTYDDPALGGKAIARDPGGSCPARSWRTSPSRAALSAYVGRNLSGGTGLVLFIGAFGWSLTSPRRLLLGTTSDFAPTAALREELNTEEDAICAGGDGGHEACGDLLRWARSSAPS